MILLSLVGEQPIPNLLVARALEPRVCVWAHTDRTKPIAERLRQLLDPLPTTLLPVAPYDVDAIERQLTAWLLTQDRAHVVFNLTGGTKPMAWAAERVAARYTRPFVYLQTEGRATKLFRYQPHGETLALVESREVPALITITDYLHAHGLWHWRVKHESRRSPFERLVEPVVRRACDEVHCNLDFNAFEMDFVIRRGNHVGVVECKSGKRKSESKRAGIDQLVIASDNKYLGTYTERFLITDSVLPSNLNDLAEARKIHVIPLVSAPTHNYQRLLASEERRLIQTIQSVLGK